MAKTPALKVPLTKTQLVSEIATKTELTKQQVSSVIDELGNQIERHVEKKGPGTFTMPGLLKIKTIRKPATKARKGINPFTQEETMFKAKPAHTAIKIHGRSESLRRYSRQQIIIYRLETSPAIYAGLVFSKRISPASRRGPRRCFEPFESLSRVFEKKISNPSSRDKEV